MKVLHEKVIITCGVVLMLLPFTGFPLFWKKVLTVLIGLVVTYFGLIILRGIRRHKREEHSEKRTETFTETN